MLLNVFAESLENLQGQEKSGGQLESQSVRERNNSAARTQWCWENDNNFHANWWVIGDVSIVNNFTIDLPACGFVFLCSLIVSVWYFYVHGHGYGLVKFKSTSFYHFTFWMQVNVKCGNINLLRRNYSKYTSRQILRHSLLFLSLP